MRITVLGKSPAWQDAGGACSGYLVEESGTCILIDCGCGVFGKLRRHRDYIAVDAVLITHLHADHIFDLVPFASALTYAPRQQPVPVDRWPGVAEPVRPALYAPHGARESFALMCQGGGMFPDHVEQAFALSEYGPGDSFRIGGIEVSFAAVPHYLPTCAVDLRLLTRPAGATASGRFTFGADSAPSDEVVAFAQGTDLLMLEATLPRPERSGIRGHLTPREAGEHAARAGARRLVLTHISDELDALWAVDEARAAFGGEVTVAAEDAVYVVE
ncbi:MAG: fold metallo-hydrolase [Solirubrobacterales bacterium]|nr:fold metallo-hydrolase [Solirubrobacterales bacterium]